jgi:hypothetical protein
MTRRGRWIYSIDGLTTPGDAEDDFATKAEAVAAAIARYWTDEDRKRIRANHAKTGGYRLRFYVGLVVQASLSPIPWRDLVASLVGEQSDTSNIPLEWPDASEAQLLELQAQVHAVVKYWLAGLGAMPGWDTVNFEEADVEA